MDLKERALDYRQIKPLFEGQTRHAIDATLPRGDQGNLQTLGRQGKSLAATGPFLGEAPIPPQLIRPAQGLQQIQIEAVSRPDTTSGERPAPIAGQKIQGAWTTTNKVELTSGRPPLLACLGHGQGGGSLFPGSGTGDRFGYHQSRPGPIASSSREQGSRLSDAGGTHLLFHNP
jgi:hypothetical protein